MFCIITRRNLIVINYLVKGAISKILSPLDFDVLLWMYTTANRHRDIQPAALKSNKLNLFCIAPFKPSSQLILMDAGDTDNRLRCFYNDPAVLVINSKKTETKSGKTNKSSEKILPTNQSCLFSIWFSRKLFTTAVLWRSTRHSQVSHEELEWGCFCFTYWTDNFSSASAINMLPTWRQNEDHQEVEGCIAPDPSI